MTTKSTSNCIQGLAYTAPFFKSGPLGAGRVIEDDTFKGLVIFIIPCSWDIKGFVQSDGLTKSEA